MIQTWERSPPFAPKIMDRETTAKLQSLGIDPQAVINGVTYKKSGNHYQNAWFWKEIKGYKLFRTIKNGKLALRAEEQMIEIFG